MPRTMVMGILLLLAAAYLALPGANTAKANLADHVVVNEISIDSVSGAGGSDDDWVELFNPTGSAVSLDGWSIQKTPASGLSPVKAALSGSIPADGYYLIVRNGATTAQPLKDAADLLAGDSFSLASNNIVYLVNDDSIIADSADDNIVDFVGFGTASFFEGAAAAPNIPEAKSIARVPDGEDTDENSVDFVIQDIPTPTNSQPEADNDIGGNVSLTIMPDTEPVRNITPTGADIIFSVNTDGTAQVNYGLDDSYGETSAVEAVTENSVETITLSGLVCATTYHYSIYAENIAGTENDTTADATFATLPCGIRLDSLVMTKDGAKANNQYGDGWIWQFDITVWNMDEISLKMKFDAWSGAGGVLAAGGNMQFSADNGATWLDITADSAYPAIGADIFGIDLSADDGRQVIIVVRMKVPMGTAAGYYSSSYGILTE